MGVVFQENNDLAGALVCYKRALKLDPEFALARVNMGIVLLLEGQMETGWIQYEYRWLLEPKPKLRHGGSLAWRGCEDLSGKVILLHSDQGFGDAIQFLRYAEILNSKGARVHVEVPSVLVEIAKQTRGVESVVPLDHPAQTFDHHCPLLSLPLACRTTLESIPANIPYLRASREAKHKWDSLILPRARARIALCWRGNPLHANDHNRSASIRDLAPLLERKDCLFISVQLSPTSDESDVLRSCSSAVDVTSEIASFDDTAAILEKVDLVISVDSAVAHLAGALGKKTWMLLPFAPDWRWMLRRTDSPWYPTVRLFRQQVTGDWRSAVEAVCTHLDECLTDGSIGTSGVDA
jgi:hypothetical protein